MWTTSWSLARRSSCIRLALAAPALLAGLVASAQSTPTENDRLLATGKLWITVKYFHPYLAYKPLDWDRALVEALPKIRAAKTSAEYASAVQSMLDALQDPASYVMLASAKPVPTTLKLETSGGALLVSQLAGAESPDAAGRLARAIHNSEYVVFDLRSGSGSPDYLSHLLDEDQVARELAVKLLRSPDQRTWIHHGLTDSAFLTRQGARIPQEPAGPEHKLAFILGEESHLPAIGCARSANGTAIIFSESMHYQSECAETVQIPMGQGVQAVVRLSEPLRSRPVSIAPREFTAQQALAALEKPGEPAREDMLPARAPDPAPDKDYAEMRFPAVEYRILAAYKIWAVFKYFFAYRDLMDEDWDEVFSTFLPRFIAAANARDYNLTVAEMLTHVTDSQASVESEELSEYFGKAAPGLRLRLIEKKPVITAILDNEARKAGVQVGDIVSKVDGESIVDRFNRQAGYIASSTPQWNGYRVMERILNGPDGSLAALTIGGQDGRTREVNLKRSLAHNSALRDQRTGDVLRLLSGNVGYADLDRLMPDQLDQMFDKFRDTRAIVFDLRGAVHGTAPLIAARLATASDVPAAIVTRLLTLAPDVPRGDLLTSSGSYFFVQRLPETDRPKYRGKTVMLTDERTIGEAEHAALFLEAANKTECVGSASAGSDGEVATLVVPGGIRISFSVSDVRHANGGKLQRLGVQPAVTVNPSIHGIRSGRDEVLERAVEYLSK